jgi:hypothetical protein
MFDCCCVAVVVGVGCHSRSILGGKEAGRSEEEERRIKEEEGVVWLWWRGGVKSV